MHGRASEGQHADILGRAFTHSHYSRRLVGKIALGRRRAFQHDNCTVSPMAGALIASVTRSAGVPYSREAKQIASEKSTCHLEVGAMGAVRPAVDKPAINMVDAIRKPLRMIAPLSMAPAMRPLPARTKSIRSIPKF
jgi:hypothetical protein